MRIYLRLTPNKTTVPFNYQRNLVGAFYKWLGGESALHDEISLYSLSWLRHLGNPRYKRNRANTGFEFPFGAEMFISSPLPDLHQKFIQGIFQDQHINWGMNVDEVNMKVTPQFGNRQVFLAQSPILIKRKSETDKHYQYFFPKDPKSNEYLTETLRRKLEKAGLSTDVSVAFDATYPKPIIKKIAYRGLDIKGTICPVIVEGDSRAVQFAWEVGVGNSTGIGFGALR
ncbi:MAG: CRISPR-associated endoribonuclease Cas6 [Bacteroidetes bacterium]|jgi:CRISPR-associated endoribonuclease Cas6|nr:CRISPR-associated endoribonuclease Cas6 [Bacteroidota bacterium]